MSLSGCAPDRPVCKPCMLHRHFYELKTSAFPSREGVYSRAIYAPDEHKIIFPFRLHYDRGRRLDKAFWAIVYMGSGSKHCISGVSRVTADTLHIPTEKLFMTSSGVKDQQNCVKFGIMLICGVEQVFNLSSAGLKREAYTALYTPRRSSFLGGVRQSRPEI